MTDDHPFRNSPSVVAKRRFVGIKIPDLPGKDIVTPIISIFREQLNVSRSDNLFWHFRTVPYLKSTVFELLPNKEVHVGSRPLCGKTLEVEREYI